MREYFFKVEIKEHIKYEQNSKKDISNNTKIIESEYGNYELNFINDANIKVAYANINYAKSYNRTLSSSQLKLDIYDYDYAIIVLNTILSFSEDRTTYLEYVVNKNDPIIKYLDSLLCYDKYEDLIYYKIWTKDIKILRDNLIASTSLKNNEKNRLAYLYYNDHYLTIEEIEELNLLCDKHNNSNKKIYSKEEKEYIASLYIKAAKMILSSNNEELIKLSVNEEEYEQVFINDEVYDLLGISHEIKEIYNEIEGALNINANFKPVQKYIDNIIVKEIRK